MPRNLYLALECALILVGLPLAMLLLGIAKAAGIFMFLWLLAFICLFVMDREGSFDKKTLWNGKAVNWRNLRPILITFLACAVLIGLYTTAFHPEKLFVFPQERPLFWALVMLLYPWLSVLPQEIIYRSFFFHRYAPLFPSARLMAISNALLFGLCHIIFHNAIAVLMTAAGGMLFARTYQRHRSLALVTLEHALYGCFVFTIGLGIYFYHGAVR